MVIALVGTFLLILAVAVYLWGCRPAAGRKMREEAVRRYAIDVQADQWDLDA